MAREVVRNLFKLSPKDFQNATEYRAAIVKQVDDLIEDSNFLHEGKDVNVSTNLGTSALLSCH